MVSLIKKGKKKDECCSNVSTHHSIMPYYFTLYWNICKPDSIGVQSRSVVVQNDVLKEV